MTVRILMFGPARDWMGTDVLSVELPPEATVKDLLAVLKRDHASAWPSLATARIAVNAKFAELDRALHPNDEIAVIPPVSGGADTYRAELTSESISVADWQHWIDDCAGNDCGATCTFVGRTRAEEHPEFGALMELEYKAYEDMALKQMRSLIEQVQERFSIRAAGVIHRLGSVASGQASVLVAVAAGHRAEAFTACRWLIDTLKAEVPIWKRENWRSGNSTWSSPQKLSDAN